MKPIGRFLLTLLTALLFTFTTVKTQTTVVDIVVNSTAHDTLEAAVIAAGLADDLSGAGPFTVFAPTDDAFKALPAGTLETLLADPTGDLADILLYHVVGAKALSTDLSNDQVITTLLGKNVTVTISEAGVFINNAQVTVADLEADNGVVHVIDAVLLPPSVTVVDIVVNSTAHDTLEAAVIAAGLADDLSGAGPFTVFAPTDDAFKALPAGTLETLLADPTGDLADILLYHVVGAKALSTDLSNGQAITTLLEKDVNVTISEAGVFINNAQVTVADLEADNGVVHVIDAVLIPPVETGLLGVSDKTKKMTIYPNPAKNFVRISGIEGKSKVNVKIYNSQGAVVVNRMLDNTSQSINIRELPVGSYYMLLEAESGSYSGKLLKE
jgi:uncharacterized surface protein with fasciclin (FAS1) repeats